MTRTAIVTGGGTGIGREIAKTLAVQGLDVTITGRREDVLSKAAAELGVSAVAFDASDPAAVEAALPRLPSRVHVLVNSAGGNAGRHRPAVADGDLAGLRDLWPAPPDPQRPRRHPVGRRGHGRLPGLPRRRPRHRPGRPRQRRRLPGPVRRARSQRSEDTPSAAIMATSLGSAAGPASTAPRSRNPECAASVASIRAGSTSRVSG